MRGEAKLRVWLWTFLTGDRGPAGASTTVAFTGTILPVRNRECGSRIGATRHPATSRSDIDPAAPRGRGHSGTGSYNANFGPIPTGLIDHLCRQRACIRLDHLEVVTQKENTLRGNAASALNARKTHCSYGHPLADAYRIAGRRVCRQCTVRRNRERIEKQAAQAGAAPPTRRPWVGTGLCGRGHALTPDNLYGPGRCRQCTLDRARKRLERLARDAGKPLPPARGTRRRYRKT